MQLDDGSLLAYCRVRGQNHFLWKITSHDNGRTWSQPEQTDIKNPSARVAMAKLGGEKLVLAFNDSNTRRTPLSLALSEDAGRTWRYTRAIETGSWAFTYPFMIVARDGTIHITYNDNYEAVKYAMVDESWFRE